MIFYFLLKFYSNIYGDVLEYSFMAFICMQTAEKRLFLLALLASFTVVIKY